MLTACHLAEKAQNINRNTENYDHKHGITSTKLASNKRSPTVASVASTISSYTLLLSLLPGTAHAPWREQFVFAKIQAQSSM